MTVFLHYKHIEYKLREHATCGIDYQVAFRSSLMQCQSNVSISKFDIWVKNYSPILCYFQCQIWQILNLESNYSIMTFENEHWLSFFFFNHLMCK